MGRDMKQKSKTVKNCKMSRIVKSEIQKGSSGI